MYVPKLVSMMKVSARRKKGLPYHATLELTVLAALKHLTSHLDGTYGNLTPYGSTLWVRVKRHAIHRGCIVLCTEDTWKATTRVHRLHMTRMVENTLLVAEGICVFDLEVGHNILLVFGLTIL